MNCCNDIGTCTQGKDCPVRKQRMKETDDAYMSGGWGKVADPYDDVADTFKALILVIAVTAAVTLLAFLFWGK
jgi:hypothetical protein